LTFVVTSLISYNFYYHNFFICFIQEIINKETSNDELDASNEQEYSGLIFLNSYSSEKQMKKIKTSPDDISDIDYENHIIPIFNLSLLACENFPHIVFRLVTTGLCVVIYYFYQNLRYLMTDYFKINLSVDWHDWVPITIPIAYRN